MLTAIARPPRLRIIAGLAGERVCARRLGNRGPVGEKTQSREVSVPQQIPPDGDAHLLVKTCWSQLSDR